MTSLFFFVSRGVYGTIAFHNFIGIVGMIRALDASGNLAVFERPVIPLLIMAVAAVAVLIAVHVLLGVFFLVMALDVNVVLVFAPGQFVALGTEDALVPLYRCFFEHVVALVPTFFGLVAAAYEIAIVFMMLSTGRYAKWGLIGGIAFPGSGYGILAHHGWCRTLAVAGAFASLAVLIPYFHPLHALAWMAFGEPRRRVR